MDDATLAKSRDSRVRRGVARAVAAFSLATALAILGSCQMLAPGPPRHYLVITHSALNRITFFDLDAQKVVGVLPAQKLPHDLLMSPDQKSVYIVNSGAQCVTAYHLDSPELWRRARDFMRRDTAHVAAPPRHAAPTMGGAAPAEPRTAPPGTGTGSPAFLNPDPVQQLPPEVAEFFLTDPTFPDTGNAAAAHVRTGARAHRACFDCHQRSRGAKPFGPVYSRDGKSIVLAQLDYRNLTLLDAVTLAVQRQIPLDLTAEFAPVEVWVRPGTDTAFVTCRDAIGESRPGRILVVDLASGRTLRSIPAGIFPWHMVPDPTGRLLLVNNFQSSRISIVDLDAQAIVDSIVVQNGPAMMMFAKGGEKLFVSCFYTDRLLVVNMATRRVEQAIPVGSNPTSMLLEADGRHLQILCGGESDLERIDLNSASVLDRHPLLFGAYAFLLVDRDRSRRWIATSGSLNRDSARTGERP